jgi:hypothetical protein
MSFTANYGTFGKSGSQSGIEPGFLRDFQFTHRLVPQQSLVSRFDGSELGTSACNRANLLELKFPEFADAAMLHTGEFSGSVRAPRRDVDSGKQTQASISGMSCPRVNGIGRPD